MIKVAVVEDDAGFRRSLIEVLKSAPGLKFVAEYSNGESAIAGLVNVAPDVVLMDLNLPDLSGAEITAQVKRQLPDLNVVILTVYNDAEHIFKALRAGACGYLLKQASAREIIESVNQAQGGGAPMTNEIARKVLTVFAEPAPAQAEGEALSAREKSILELVAQGRSNKDVADQLSLTPKTVGWYLNGIYRKLHVQSRTQAVNKYYQNRPRIA